MTEEESKSPFPETATTVDDVLAPPSEPEPVRLTTTAALITTLIAAYGLTSWPQFTSLSTWAFLLGALMKPLLEAGEYWRFVTSWFLHANLTHLGANLLALWIFGQLVEPLLGPWHMLGLLLVSGIVANLFSLWLVPEPSIGASGAIYGLLSGYCTLVLLVRQQSDPQTHRKELRGALSGLVLFVISGWLMSQSPENRINVWAHVGGLVGGIVYILLFQPQRRLRGSAF
jgi:rhomboid protease GluP